MNLAHSHRLPCFSAPAGADAAAVNDLGDDLRRLDNARAGAVKEAVSVGQCDAPGFTARSCGQPGNASSSGVSRRVRARSKPHGATIRKLGSATRTSSHGIARECAPFSPSSTRPLAASTNSGPQLPIEKIGSVHSSITTVGAGQPRTAAVTCSVRHRIRPTSSQPA
jgi:hypothetical protein